MSHHRRSLFGWIMKAVGAASAGLALSVVASPFAVADDPVGSPTPSETATAAASPGPTVTPDPSVTTTGSESPSPSPVVTTPNVTVSPTPEASVAPSPAEQRSPTLAEQRSAKRGSRNALLAAVTTTSGVLRDATTGAPIRNSCLAWRSSVTPTATNATINVDEQGRWSFDSDDPGPFYLSFYVTENGDCTHPVLTGSANYRAAWYQAQPFTGTDPNTALPPPGADPVTAGSNIVACLGTQNALPTECATPNTTVSGRVVGVGPVPIFQACVVAIGADGNVSTLAVSDANGRWTLTGLPINYDYIIAVLPPIQGSQGPCQLDGPPSAPPPGELQPEFYANTWADLSDQNLLQNPFAWATDPNSPHPAITLRNSRTSINVCLTTETGRDTQRSSCDPATPTPTPTPNPTVTASATDPPSTQPALATTGGPPLLIPAVAAALLLGAVSLLARSSSISRRSRSRPRP